MLFSFLFIDIHQRDIEWEISGADSVNIMGSCSGGITLSAYAGWLAAKEESHKINSVILAVCVLNTQAETDSDFASVSIASHASHMEMLFPPGSLSAPSEALPAIWDNWDAFAGLTRALNARADRLAQMAASGASEAEIAAQFQILGKTCSDCHEKFRIKK